MTVAASAIGRPARDEELRDHFAAGVRSAAAATLTLFAVALILNALGWLEMPKVRMAGAIVAMLAVVVLQTHAVRTTRHLRLHLFGFHCFFIFAITVAVHFLGGIQFPAGAALYALVVANAAYAGRSAYLFANLSTACLAALLLLEHHGIVRPEEPYLFDDAVVAYIVPPRIQFDYVITTWVVLNWVAAFIDRSFLKVEAARRRLASANAELEHYRDTLEQQVAERTRELEGANQELAIRGERLRTFVYTVTHDLKNPINSILLTGELLLQDEGRSLSNQGRADLQRIVVLAGQTEDMIRDLLDLFQITSMPERRSEVELDSLLAQACERLHARIVAKDVRVDVAPLPAVWGQAKKLGHVFTNLLDNAIKYVPSHRGVVSISGDARDGQLVVSVRDNGIGIAPEYHQGIFKIYGRVPLAEQHVDGASVSGSGVGLTIVRRIVEDHGGRVTVESERGRGSCFNVHLPLARP